MFGEFNRDDQRSLATGRYDQIEYYNGSFGSDLASGRFNSQALSPIHFNNGQAASADGALYGLATLSATGTLATINRLRGLAAAAAAGRLGVELSKVTVTNGVARTTIKITNEINPKDVQR